MDWRRNSVRSPSDRVLATLPPIRTSPPSARSSNPAMCSRVDLPAPDGPTSATNSPPRTFREAPRSTFNASPACRKVRTMPSISIMDWEASFIAQGLDRIELGGAPCRVDGRAERQAQRHQHDASHLGPVDLGGQLAEKIDFRRE